LHWDIFGIAWASAYSAGLASSTTTTPTPTPSPEIQAQLPSSSTTAAAATTTTSASNIVSSIESDVASLFDDLVGLANDLTAFGEATSGSGSDVGAIGNIGQPQGSNMIKVASIEGYQFTNEFINTSPDAMTIACWNKAFDGPNGVEANLGASVAPETPALTFALAPGGSQIVAFMDNSQIGCAQATSARTAAGAFDTTWLECNFDSTGSGYDMSAIENSRGNSYNMAISSSEASCVSSMTQNFWWSVNGTPTPVGNSDGSCYIGSSTATLVTKMGGTVS
jgi:hypothetical protein